MDKQFQEDLNTRRGTNVVIKRSSGLYLIPFSIKFIFFFKDLYTSLVTLQKGYVSYNDVVYDMRVQATTNRKRIGN